MISASECARLTDAQLLKDGAFIEATRRDLVLPLCEELSEVPGFLESNCEKRFEVLLKTNERLLGKGSYLFMELNGYRRAVYAGEELFYPIYEATDYAHPGTPPRPYYPRSIADEIVPGGKANLSSLLVHTPYLQQYLYRSPQEEGKSNLPEFPPPLPSYSKLPIAYRAALVCCYVHEHVIALPSDVTAFVLGATETVATHRYIVSPTVDVFGRADGWNIRIRDLRPSQAFAGHIASHLKSIVNNSERQERETLQRIAHNTLDESRLREESQFAEDESRHRATDPKTELMVAFVDDLKSHGEVIGRGGTLSWEEVAAKLSVKHPYGARSYTGRDLRDCYNSYKKRHS